MIKDVSKTAWVAQEIERRIALGDIAAGQRLPSERWLSDELGVSRVTISRAVAALIQEGRLQRARQGGVVRVLEREPVTQIRSGSVAVVFPESVQDAQYNIFFRWAFQGIENEAARHGLSVLVAVCKGQAGGVPGSLTTAKIDGLLLCGQINEPSALERLRGLGRPMVKISDDGTAQGIPSVVADDLGGSLAAMRHLLALGHRRIAFLHPPLENNTSTEARHDGYLKALRQAGDLPACCLEAVTSDVSEGARLAERLWGMHPCPTAVFCANDSMAVGLISALALRGVRVPQAMSVVGFDDSHLAETHFPPIGLTTVRSPIVQMSELAFELLFRSRNESRLGRMCQKDQAIRMVLPTELIVRGTTAVPRAG